MKGSRFASSSALISLLCLACVLQGTLGTRSCDNQPGPIANNTLPFWSGTPRLLKQVTNGKMFEVGDPVYNNTFKILHVYGTVEEMGAAQGALLGQELIDFIQSLWGYLDTKAEEYIPVFLPKFIRVAIANFGLEFILDYTFTITYKYTTKIYYEEIRAMVLAAGAIDLFDKAVRLHMLGEIVKGHGSMFGLFGKATKNGETLQLRTLDWNLDWPFSQHAALVVYHPSDDSHGYPFINIGFTGWVGMISGINAYNIAISEIGVSQEDPSFGRSSRFGNIFTFMMRDLIQFENTLQGAINRLVTNNRTCDLILGLGDGKPKVSTFRGFQVSHTVCNIVDDNNLIPNATWHPKIKGSVYYAMDWLCQQWDERLSSLINQYYGQIDAETAVRSIVGGLTSGNVQAVLYDLTNMVIYVSYGYKVENGTYTKPAYQQSFVKLDVRNLFAEPQPTAEDLAAQNIFTN